jgi:hypothetical protein
VRRRSGQAERSCESIMDTNVRKHTLRMLSNGIYIVTSASGDRYGAATVTWLSQASFKPPLVMAAIRPDSNVFKCMSESGVAAVHVLDLCQLQHDQRRAVRARDHTSSHPAKRTGSRRMCRSPQSHPGRPRSRRHGSHRGRVPRRGPSHDSGSVALAVRRLRSIPPSLHP